MVKVENNLTVLSSPERKEIWSVECPKCGGLIIERKGWNGSGLREHLIICPGTLGQGEERGFIEVSRSNTRRN